MVNFIVNFIINFFVNFIANVIINICINFIVKLIVIFILRQNMHFQKTILFTDEACFTRRGITNMHNYHEYSDENPLLITPRYLQREFKINVWVVLIDLSLFDWTSYFTIWLTGETLFRVSPKCSSEFI